MRSLTNGSIAALFLLTACTTTPVVEKEASPQRHSSTPQNLEPVSLSKNDCVNGKVKTGIITELYNQGNKAHLMDPASANMPAGTTVIHMLNHYTLGAISEHICKGGANEFKPKEAIIPLNPK